MYKKILIIKKLFCEEATRTNTSRPRKNGI